MFACRHTIKLIGWQIMANRNLNLCFVSNTKGARTVVGEFVLPPLVVNKVN